MSPLGLAILLIGVIFFGLVFASVFQPDVDGDSGPAVTAAMILIAVFVLLPVAIVFLFHHPAVLQAILEFL